MSLEKKPIVLAAPRKDICACATMKMASPLGQSFEPDKYGLQWAEASSTLQVQTPWPRVERCGYGNGATAPDTDDAFCGA